MKMSIDELEAAWNARADAMNQWDELGIDEIVASRKSKCVRRAPTYARRSEQKKFRGAAMHILKGAKWQPHAA